MHSSKLPFSILGIGYLVISGMNLAQSEFFFAGCLFVSGTMLLASVYVTLWTERYVALAEIIRSYR